MEAFGLVDFDLNSMKSLGHTYEYDYGLEEIAKEKIRAFSLPFSLIKINILQW